MRRLGATSATAACVEEHGEAMTDSSGKLTDYAKSLGTCQRAGCDKPAITRCGCPAYNITRMGPIQLPCGRPLCERHPVCEGSNCPSGEPRYANA